MHQQSRARHGHDEFARYLDVSPEAVPDARHAFQTWLGGQTSDAELVADMAVVVSELASNAVVGSEGTGHPIEIRAAVDRGELELQVVNVLRPGLDQVVRWDLDDPLRGGGRGLMIVRAYTDTLEIESSGSVVTVRCTRLLGPT